ncbi:MAG: hypothetical protein V8Q79_09600 [Christensenellales bacterium]
MASIQISGWGIPASVWNATGMSSCWILFEPGSVPGCKDIQNVEADQVLCSHEHGDHNYRQG